MKQPVGLTTPLLRVCAWAALVGVYTVLALFKTYPPFSYFPEITSEMDAVLSFAMALVIAFRLCGLSVSVFQTLLERPFDKHAGVNESTTNRAMAGSLTIIKSAP